MLASYYVTDLGGAIVSKRISPSIGGGSGLASSAYPTQGTAWSTSHKGWILSPSPHGVYFRCIIRDGGICKMFVGDTTTATGVPVYFTGKQLFKVGTPRWCLS